MRVGDYINSLAAMDSQKIWATTDLHGYKYELFLSMVKKAKLKNKRSELYVLGDVFDRGKNGKEMYNTIRFIMNNQNVVHMLKGNHEAMLIKCASIFESANRLSELKDKELADYNLWLANGAETTIKMLYDLSYTERMSIIKFIQSRPLYKEVFLNGKRFILCHSGLGNFSPSKSLSDYSENDLLWYRPELNQCFYYDEATTIVFGHTPTPYLEDGNEGTAIITKTWICIDTGSAIGGKYHPILFGLHDYSTIHPDIR